MGTLVSERVIASSSALVLTGGTVFKYRWGYWLLAAK